MDNPLTIVWLRQDLRLADHPALAAAITRGGPVLPVYVLDEGDAWAPGGASRWWLHQSLAALKDALGGALVLRRGKPEEVLPSLVAETGARAVLWNRRYEPHEAAREGRVGRALSAAGIDTRIFPGSLLFEPGSVLSKGGNPFQVFTAFWRCALSLPEPAKPIAAPRHIPAPAIIPASDDLGLMPRLHWWQGMAAQWQPGEAGAAARLRAFLDGAVETYAVMRDRPDEEGTSRLSPHLAFGEISPRQVWHAAMAQPDSTGRETFLKELGWREFSYSLLATHPDLPHRPLRREFEAFAWASDDAGLEAWRKGMTGYPIVDAGMRQLWQTGWMHNRVRMIVASFLVKDLLLPWATGEEWFWDTLVDADLAANAASWQWVAGCGADAAPYFRVFNPVLQGEKFDPHGRYVRRWVPELAGMPDPHIHRPWEAPPLMRAGLKYPLPVVDHGTARKRALAAYQGLKG